MHKSKWFCSQIYHNNSFCIELLNSVLTQVRVCTNMTNNPNLLTDRELEDVTAVFRFPSFFLQHSPFLWFRNFWFTLLYVPILFNLAWNFLCRSFETGLREATIHPKVVSMIRLSQYIKDIILLILILIVSIHKENSADSERLQVICRISTRQWRCLDWTRRSRRFPKRWSLLKAKNVKIISEQVVDIPNEIAKSGHIYFPEFCKLVLDRFRQIRYDSLKSLMVTRFWLVGFSRKGGTEDDLFRQNMFKVPLVLCFG